MRWLALLAALGCKGKISGDTGFEVVGPDLAHSAPEGTYHKGDSVDLSVEASDPDGVKAVVLYHRTEGDEFFETDALQGSGGLWTGTVDGLESPGLEYYFKATDGGDPPAVSYLPEDGSSDPFVLAVAEASLALPFLEDFEPADDETSLYAMGWWTPSDATFTGYQFALTDSMAYSGDYSAFHSRGSTGTGELRDWLISPALDFSGTDGVMVSWYELGNGTEGLQEHGLYVSTTSRLPEDGGFEPVEAALAAPEEDAWGRSAAYDLSAWAGEPLVYLAWLFVGEEADDWYIDDVYVRALGADLDAQVGWSPDPVHPGETTWLTVLFTNASNGAATGVEATLSFPEGGASAAEETAEVGDIEPQGSATALFEVTVDPDLRDNRYLPLLVSATDGTETWEFELQLLVGLPSTGEIAFTLDESVAVSIDVGVGDPDDPDLAIDVDSGFYAAGDHTLQIDLTDWYAWLPPAAGDQRWFARIEATGSGTFESFSIDYGGETVANTTSATIEGGVALDVYLPEPPDPTVSDVSPNTLEPGQTGVALTLALTNDGAATSGAVTGVLSSADGDVTVRGDGAFVLTSGAWGAGETVTASGFTIDVSDEHVDSTPVLLQLELSDEVESWTFTFGVDVPWPVLRIKGIDIDDSGGDGILDPGEAATLEIDIVNTGDLDAFGSVQGTLSVESTSTASATVSSGEEWFGTMNVGSSRDAKFDITVDGGAAGDTLDLLLTLTDGTNTYTSQAQIVLGEPPWFLLGGTDDIIGDALDDYAFDFVNGRYRVVDGTFELLLESQVAYDPTTLFIEAWGTSAGADWDYYRWVLQSGTATMQGFDNGVGFTSIGTMAVEYPSVTQLALSWETGDMDLALDTFSIGLAAGWCGPPDYYCDQYPDGWGYPYDSFYPSAFYDVSW